MAARVCGKRSGVNGGYPASARNARARALGWVPEYPSYREGYRAILAGR